MSWSLSRMTRYVQKCKYLQSLKDNDDVCNQAFERGSYLLFSNGRPFLAPSKKESGKTFYSAINWRTLKDVETFNPSVKQSSIVLDVDEEKLTPLFACPISPDVEKDVQNSLNGAFMDMRRALFSLSDEHNRIVTRGYCMVTWDEGVKYCCYCGSPLERKVSGCAKVCSKQCNPRKMTHYPQIHPVAIIRVVNHAGDKILLVRQPQHPRGLYTCIAGFMEPGEVLQDNVIREIAEESGIVIDKPSIAYFQSQSWPLPQTSLMLACTATAVEGSEKIEIDNGELEDARWFTKEEVSRAINRVKENPKLIRENESGDLIVPPNGAIAHQLILAFLNKYSPNKL